MLNFLFPPECSARQYTFGKLRQSMVLLNCHPSKNSGLWFDMRENTARTWTNITPAGVIKLREVGSETQRHIRTRNGTNEAACPPFHKVTFDTTINSILMSHRGQRRSSDRILRYFRFWRFFLYCKTRLCTWCVRTSHLDHVKYCLLNLSLLWKCGKIHHLFRLFKSAIWKRVSEIYLDFSMNWDERIAVHAGIC